ncbi:unnamed protein product [Closterium sp. Yama58-4]|nr:unnamed protein product [Closterium sp. Yama58-4]
MQVRSRSFNGHVDGPVSPLAASPVLVSPLSARFEPSRRNEFSRRDDSIGSATGIYAHAHTFTSANPPLSSSGPRSASLERSPESYGVESAVSNADMYAFCPLAVASSTPGRRPPRRGPGGSGSFSGRYARSPSPQRAAAPAAPVEPLRLGPLISAIGQADVTAIRDAVKAVRAAIKATPENKKRLIQAGGVQFLINLVAESPDGDTVEHAVTVLYNVCREEGGRDAIVSGAEGGLEALVKALRAEKAAARENAAAALFCLAWGIQTVSGNVKGGRGSRGPSPSRPARGRSTSVGAISTSPAVSARSSPHTPSIPPSPSLKSPTASTALMRSPYDSREFSGVFSGAGNSPEGPAQAAAGLTDASSGAGEAATEAVTAGEPAAATARTEATAGAAGATAGAADATAGGADATADGEQGKRDTMPPQSSTPSAEAAAQKAREQLAEIKLRIGKAGAIPALVEIFLSGSSRGKIDAVLAVLALLSGGDHHRELLQEFLNTGGLNILLNMVQEPNEDLENRAMALVSFIACSSMGRHAIKEAKSANGNGGLEVIADVLDLTTSQKARQEAVSALLLLARHDEEARRVIGREGVVPALHRVTREAKGSAGDKAKELLVLLREQSASGQLQAAA